MNNKNLKKLILYILLLVPYCGISQTEDAHLWTGAGVSLKVDKKLSFGYETQTRFYNNVSSLRVYLNQIGASYKITKDFKVGLDYRFSRKKKDYYYVSDNRLMFNASYGYKIKPANMKLTVRARYQNSFDRLNTINSTIEPNISNVFRMKVVAKYKNPDFKRVQPFVGYEYFKSLDAEPIQFATNRFRVIGGLHLDLPKKHELKLYYIYQESNKAVPEIDHIYSIQYTYNLEGLFGK